MFKNYLKVGIRNILKYKVFSFINLFGLAAGMSVCMLIILMLAEQKSYDQFHDKKDRIYRILTHRKGSLTPNASTPLPLAGTLKSDYPLIEEATTLVMGVGGGATYRSNSMEARGYFADKTFFDVFSYELGAGDERTALTEPNSIVLSSDLARQLFGDEDPVGKPIEFADRGLNIIRMDFVAMGSSPVSWGSFRVTGVLADWHNKSHLKFDALISSASRPALYEAKKVEDLTDDWQTYSRCYTYVVLKPGTGEAELQAALTDIAKRKYAGLEDFEGFSLPCQKLTSITPGHFMGNPPTLRLPVEIYYFLGSLALIVIILAGLNYTNLSIARSLTRTKEIGVRKVTGAKRQNLIFQFLGESILTALLALVVASGLLVVVKAGFVNLWLNRYLHFELQDSLTVYVIFVGLSLLTGLLAGFFPALNLSKYQPVKVLKNFEIVRPKKFGLRKILIVSQFVVSLFFIITAILIYFQVDHFMGFEYGFRSDNIVNVELQGNDYRLMANELRSVPGVMTVSACAFIPATGMFNEVGLKRPDSDDVTGVDYLPADESFVDNLELRIVAGRNLPPMPGSSDRFILVNETAVEAMGYETPSQAIGQTFLMRGNPDDPVEVIGVMQDFHFQSAMLADQIKPFMLRDQPAEFSYLNVRIASNELQRTIAQLEGKWQTIDPVHSFRYYFFDEQIAAVNQALGDVLTILSFIAFLVVTIACLGLLGMSMYTTERRRKEIGIRKVLGAAETSIAFLLSREFLKILAVSIVIAAPLSFFANNAWLQNFPNRVDFGVGTVLLGVLVLVVFGVATIGWQTIRAAKSNPVESLRTE